MLFVTDPAGAVIGFFKSVNELTIPKLNALLGDGGGGVQGYDRRQLSARLFEIEQRWLREIKDDLADAERRGVLFCSAATAFEIAADVMRCEQPNVCSAACRLIGGFPRAADRLALITAILESVRQPIAPPTI